LPFILQGCENLSLTLREEDEMRVYESRIIRKHVNNQVTGGWRKFHN
jgi:hypothetical protein